MIQLLSMNIITNVELLEAVEAFLARTNMPHTRFGREVMADGALVQHLRAGRDLSLSNANKVLRYMREWTPEQTGRAA